MAKESLAPTPTVNHSEDSPEFEEPDDHHTFPDTSPSQTRSKTKTKKYLARCQKSDSVLSRLQKDDGDSSGKQGHTHLGVSKSGVIRSAAKSGQNSTTEPKGKHGSSNTNGKIKVAANSLRTCGDYEADTARPDRPYCTQACLLGLLRGRALDKNCPNVKAHRRGTRANRYSPLYGMPKVEKSEKETQ